ncbi:MAG: hypothetical protein QW196_05760 [Sulfolobales archaeon]
MMKRLLMITGLVLALVIVLLVSFSFLAPKTPSVKETPPGVEETPPAMVERNGWRLAAERIELVSGEDEVYLAIYVNASNMGRSNWYIEPVKQFTLVLEDGREVKAVGTSLWGGFYYVKPGETIAFYVVFPVADDVKPYKLVARFDEAIIEVRLEKVLIYRLVAFQKDVEVLVKPDVSATLEYGRGFICRERKFFGPYGPPQLPAPLNPYECLILVPLGSTTITVTVRVEIRAQQPVIVKVVEYGGSVVSVNPKELLLKTQGYVELELELKVPEDEKPIKLAVVVQVEPSIQG